MCGGTDWTGNGCGVNGYDGDTGRCGGAEGIIPGLGAAAAIGGGLCIGGIGGPDGCIGVVIKGGAAGVVVSSSATITAGAFMSSTGARVGGIVCGRDDA
jgi:hypothetical protein